MKYIVGNKTDKVRPFNWHAGSHIDLAAYQEFARTVTKAEGQAYAMSKGCLFKECSAKRNEGIEDVFDKLVDEVGKT